MMPRAFAARLGDVTGVEANPLRLGGFTARTRPAFGARPTLRFAGAVSLTIAWVGFAETGCAPGPRKPSWIIDAFARARADGVDALVWFEFNKETDWRLSEGAAAADAARVALARGWRHGGDLAAIERVVRR